MLNQSLAIASLVGALTVALGQDTIVYSSGPSFPFPAFEENGGAPVDLNGDGFVDVLFASGFTVCTTDIPVSGCTLPYSAWAEGTNGILRRLSQAVFLQFGELIGSVTPTNSTWTSTDPYLTVANFHFSPRYGTRGWSGPLHPTAIGYLGVRFYARDGLHYGWVRVRETSATLNTPMVVDWAYETRTNSPIRAGDIGSGGMSQQFTVKFPGAGNIGTMILTGEHLRSELTLNDSFTLANVGGPAPVHARAKPVASFSPLAEREFATGDYTAFFGETFLTQAQIRQLLRGANYVSLDDGALVGLIAPR